MLNIIRCSWAVPNNVRYINYHDNEWGMPCYDEVRLFEMLNLEGAQAGLSWEIILNKRDNYNVAFDGWNAEKIALYDENKISELLCNPGIIRNRLKIAAAISNAKAYLKLRDEIGSLSDFLWGYVNGIPIQNSWKEQEDRPNKTPLSDSLSKDLKRRGFKFVGSTTIYAYMESIGMINDHSTNCFRHHMCMSASDKVADSRESHKVI